MEMNKKNQRSHIRVFFIMFLFAMCFTLNLVFLNSYPLYELSDKTTASETETFSENIAVNGDDDTIVENICIISMTAALPEGFNLFLFLIIVFLFFYLTLFILLPDEWTLFHQKVRLDN